MTMTTILSPLLLMLTLTATRAMADPSSHSIELTSQQIQDIVDRHNQLRAGEGASNMEVMRWNSQLADQAQVWADGCVNDHPNRTIHVDYNGIGQNLHLTSGSVDVSGAVQGWFDEKSYYYYDYNACATGPGIQCGHYTQVVWATSNEVGCGLTFCSSIDGWSNAEYFVCNYRPSGNILGQKPFKKGAACSECNSGVFYCSNNLCDDSCSGSGQESTCQCAAQCGNCGTPTSDCKCECEPGWKGVACNEECVDSSAYCGGNPGYAHSWCDEANRPYVRRDCPAWCGLCEAAGEQACSLTRSWRSAVDSGKSLRQQQQQHGQPVNAINKLREKQ